MTEEPDSELRFLNAIESIAESLKRIIDSPLVQISVERAPAMSDQEARESLK